MTDYLSDRENGPCARAEQVISSTVWAGLVGTAKALVNKKDLGGQPSKESGYWGALIKRLGIKLD